MSASLLAYFALTYLVAWTFWFGAGMVAGVGLPLELRGLFFLPGTFAPAIVAIWMTTRAEGRFGTESLLSGLFVWNVGVRWYVFAVGYLAAAKLAAAAIHRALVGEWPAFGETPLYLLLVAVALSAPFQAGEEIGWRGYALPRMASRMGAGPASVVLGVIWALWHVPLFLMPGTTTTGQPFLPYCLSVTALSVGMAWLYLRTRGSLLLLMILHAAVNNTKDIVPAVATPGAIIVAGAPLMAWLTTAVLWLGAMYFLARMTRPEPSPDESCVART